MTRAHRWLRRLSQLALVALLGLLSCTVLVGPWPVYSSTNYTEATYFMEAMEDIRAGAARSGISDSSGPLHAGWASRKITPPIGTPLAGFSSRHPDKPSTGVRDDLYARALAIHDGSDTALILVGDMLIVPPNIAASVRDALAKSPGISPDDILFNATHTHCGPGAFAPGIGSRITGGAYDPGVERMIVDAMIEAAREAIGNLIAVEWAAGSIDAPEYIENRERKWAPVDSELALLSLRSPDGPHALLVSYAAHATVFNSKTTEFSRDYPGELQDALAESTGAEVIFVSGAVGAMGDDPPKGKTRGERAEKMGQGLAKRAMRAYSDLEYSDRADLASFGLPVGMPPIQVRPVNRHFRVSPWAAAQIGVQREGWVQFVRLGNLVFVGMPFDFGGEISLKWKAWSENRGIDLWPTSFSGDYCGYLSPDEYYLREPLGYETGLMSWFGPEIESQMTDLFHAAVREWGLAPGPGGGEEDNETQPSG